MLDTYIDFAVDAVTRAGHRILPFFRTAIGVDNKADTGYDPVTRADRAAEESIRADIARTFPTHGIVGEEFGEVLGASPLHWLIDPIDGTRAFIAGQLHWGTLLALNDGTAPIVGVMHQPYVGETFVGSARGAELQRAGASSRLRTRTCARIEDAVVCATDPGMFATAEHRAAFERLATRCRMVRFGGDCYTPCLLAAGHIDIVIENGLKPFDVQPLMPIVQAAGGVATDWRGRAPDRGGEALFVGDPALLAAVLALLAG
jgi:histidinol-phosphatase